MPIASGGGGLAGGGGFASGGVQGPQGPQGTQGTQGHQGTQGNQGTQGSGGAQGSQGNQGNTGAQGPAGSGASGAAIVRKFPFAFNTPNILTGHAVYTPTIGDVFLDAWFEIDTAWDGTTPQGDLSQFLGGKNAGIYSGAGGGTPIDMTVANADATAGLGLAILIANQTLHLATVDDLNNGRLDYAVSGASVGWAPLGVTNGSSYLPAKFTAAAPIKVVVSQDGTNTGADPGSTQGAAVLYLVTATPV